MAGTVVADTLRADSTSTLVLRNGVANTPPTIQDSAGTQIGTFCRAWVNFNGTGTVAIRASFNVTSITDNGSGDYTVNFTNALPDANYAASITGHRGDSTSGPYTTQPLGTTGNAYTSLTTSSIRIQAVNSAGTGVDGLYVGVAIFR